MNQNRYIREAMVICGLLFLGLFQLFAHPAGKTLEGARVDIFGDDSKNVVVILFVAVECPISNRFAPEVNRIYEEFENSDFQMWTVYTDDLFTRKEIEAHRRDYQYRVPALTDFDRALARYCVATVTPEAAVFIREGSGKYRMVYRGRVNNQYVDFGRWRPKATRHDLREFLERLASGKDTDIAFRSTEAIGCYIGE